MYKNEIPKKQDRCLGSLLAKRFSATVNDHLASKTLSLWPELFAITLYGAVVAFAIAHHEPWADEAQAWQLARSLSLPSLFMTYIRYEASPGLWHFLLWILVRVHVSYAGLHWICGAIAVGATALLVFKSPFPRYLKLALPFTFFLIFQYAVVARNYVLVPPLLYLAAIWWKKSPIILAFILGMLANVSLHSAVISGGLAIVYLLEKVRNGSVRDTREHRRLWQAIFILLGLYAIAVWTAWPPHDFLTHISIIRSGQSSSFLLKFVASLSAGVCHPWYLFIPFWITIALWLKERHSLVHLLPVLLFAVFCGVVGLRYWHAGLLIPLLTCLLWITWPDLGSSLARREAAGRIAMVAVTALQISWAFYAINYDYGNAYSCDLATSDFIRPLVQRGATVAVTSLYDPEGDAFRAVGILPYFDHNIFVNLPNPFWIWSDQNPTEELFDKALSYHPDVVIAEVRPLPSNQSFGLAYVMQDPKTELLSRSGYRLTNMFCGALPDPANYRLLESCHLIFLPQAVPRRASPQ